MLITINTLGGDTHIQYKLKHAHIDTHIHTVMHTHTHSDTHTNTHAQTHTN